MKKSLVALALLSAFGMSAQATEVKIYGKVDVGLMYTSVDTGAPGADRKDNLSMLSGQTAGSRVGMTAMEDLGNGYQVGFKLETGFTPDTGALAQGGRLFGRQADLRIVGPFGTLKIGRMGSLASGYPDTGLFGGNMTPFAVGFGDVPGHRFFFAGKFSPLDNAVTYSTPSYGGWQLMLQYSSDCDSTAKNIAGTSGPVHGTENESTVDKYMGLAAHYADGTTEFNAVLDSTNYASYNLAQPNDYGDDDSLVFTIGARHKTDIATWYGAAQYFKDARNFLQSDYQGTGFLKSGPRDGYGIVVGADIPAPAGYFKAALSYMKAEDSRDSDNNLKRYAVSLGYWYDFSKRTALYTDIGYLRDKLDKAGYTGDDADVWSANLGIVHNF